jgi:hypothetical protein
MSHSIVTSASRVRCGYSPCKNGFRLTRLGLVGTVLVVFPAAEEVELALAGKRETGKVADGL